MLRSPAVLCERLSRGREQKTIRDCPAKNGYRYPAVFTGWPQPHFEGIFHRIWLPLSIDAPKPNTGYPLKKWISLTIQWIATEPNAPLVYLKKLNDVSVQGNEYFSH
jgi:hypothetical protein